MIDVGATYEWKCGYDETGSNLKHSCCVYLKHIIEIFLFPQVGTIFFVSALCQAIKMVFETDKKTC